ncbi:MAG: 4Fe-4S binding protein, partial [Candidatus Hodarchaeota archaeon]
MLVQEISEELFDEIIDARSYNSRELNKHLNFLRNDHKKVLIKNPHSLHFIAAGCTRDIDLIINGSVGYYAATCGDKLRMHVYGNGGWYVGDNMTSGTLIVEGDVGDGVAQGNYGAKVIVKGDATARTAQLHKRGMVIIGGKTSSMTGLFMMGGIIIILGDSGTNTGEMIVGGEIFVGGEIESLGKNAKIVEPTSDDLEKLKKQLPIYGFDTDYNFKKVVPVTLRPFYNPKLHERLSIKRNIPVYSITIRHDLCTFCKACVRNCPVKVFEADEENEKIIPVREVECVKCEYCMER